MIFRGALDLLNWAKSSYYGKDLYPKPSILALVIVPPSFKILSKYFIAIFLIRL